MTTCHSDKPASGKHHSVKGSNAAPTVAAGFIPPTQSESQVLSSAFQQLKTRTDVLGVMFLLEHVIAEGQVKSAEC
jgi:hypothetical protein